jgi:preprotein translocase subunit YajC
MSLLQIILLQAGGSAGGSYIQIAFLIAIVAVFYFFMMRPQQQKQAKQKTFIEELKKGDKVVTVGGIQGKIVQLSGDDVILEVDKSTKITLSKSYVSYENTEAAKS